MNEDLKIALKQLGGDAALKTTPGELLVNGMIEDDPSAIMKTFSNQFFFIRNRHQ